MESLRHLVPVGRGAREAVDGEGAGDCEDKHRDESLEDARGRPEHDSDRCGDRVIEPLAEHPAESERGEDHGGARDEPVPHGSGPPRDGRTAAEQIRDRQEAEGR